MSWLERGQDGLALVSWMCADNDQHRARHLRRLLLRLLGNNTGLPIEALSRAHHRLGEGEAGLPALRCGQRFGGRAVLILFA